MSVRILFWILTTFKNDCAKEKQSTCSFKGNRIIFLVLSFNPSYYTLACDWNSNLTKKNLRYETRKIVSTSKKLFGLFMLYGFITLNAFNNTFWMIKNWFFSVLCQLREPKKKITRYSLEHSRNIFKNQI